MPIEMQQHNSAYNKCALFEDGVLAHVLTYAPANIAQEFNRGLCYQLDENEEFKRANKTRDGYHFYRFLRGDSVDFQLSGACVDIMNGVVRASGRAGRILWGTGSLQCYCQTYVEQKLQACRTYAATFSRENNVSALNLFKWSW